MADQLHRIVETLRLLASAEQQIAFQQAVPIADVSAELFCLWDEAFYLHDSELRLELGPAKWSVLLRFNDVFERVSRLIPGAPLPTIEEFIRWPQWLQLSRAAARALRDLEAADLGN